MCKEEPMEKLDLCVPCLFGLEGLVGNELRRMDVEAVMPENGRVRFRGDKAAVARVNLRSRFGERVLIELGRFRADTFDRLFEGTKALPWETFVPIDGAFPVKGYSLESALHSIPDCQKIVKKAVVERLKQRYHVQWFSEKGAKFQIQFAIMHDEAVLYLDTISPHTDFIALDAGALLQSLERCMKDRVCPDFLIYAKMLQTAVRSAHSHAQRIMLFGNLQKYLQAVTPLYRMGIDELSVPVIYLSDVRQACAI